MTSALSQLRQLSTIVADTGDIEAIAKFQPQDATTNPSLLLKAVTLPKLADTVQAAIASAQGSNDRERVLDASDRLAVAVGSEIVKLVKGRVSTEVDARLSFDTQASLLKARRLIELYEANGVSRDRILIKLAATWEGIRAAEQLEHEGIQTNLTLLFSFAQARACADAGVFLISPFVGRILDWHLANGMEKPNHAMQDPGVQSVHRIWDFYKQHGYRTIVMGASFRNIGEVLALAGCDRLTISPDLLNDLQDSSETVQSHLTAPSAVQPAPAALTEAEFRWEHNQDQMAVEKLSDGIRKFAADQVKLEALIAAHPAFTAG
ncbi:transaldolase [Luteimonas sp. FXH3W]|uniref:Transaldolase n=1 Tax=Aquilutibacter rugosus TaxID=3115820 RepID=A0ABU7UY41_9GAMM